MDSDMLPVRVKTNSGLTHAFVYWAGSRRDLGPPFLAAMINKTFHQWLLDEYGAIYLIEKAESRDEITIHTEYLEFQDERDATRFILKWS